MLLDYRLDAEATAAGKRRGYRGGSIAAVLKEHIPDMPIVLVTTEHKFRKNLTGKPEVRRLFDHTVLKQRIASRSERPQVVLELTELATGFREIREATGSGWSRVTGLLRAGNDARSVTALALASPPAGTTEIAQWILHGFIAYPGLLVDEADAAAMLGVAASSMRRSEVRNVLAACAYDGPFSRWHERWWRGRLQRWLTAIASDRQGIAGEERAPVIAKHLDVSRNIVRSATCVWCGGRNVVRACTLCRQAVDPQHALPALVDERPRWVDNATLCFECIQRGRVSTAHFQPGTEQIAASIQSGRLRPEDRNGR